MSNQFDPRDGPIARLMTRYRRANPGASYAESARAVCFDPPWSEELAAILGPATHQPGGPE